MSGKLILISHYEYLAMLFGLTNAPNVFQCITNNVLRDMTSEFVFVYFSLVQQMLQCLLENLLFVNAEK